MILPMARRSGKGAGIFAPSKKRAVSIIPMDIEQLTNAQALAKERELRNFIKTREFERRTDKTVMMKKIEDYVKRGMAAYEEDINTRRLKLRDMIQAEEAELTREVVDQLRQKANSRTEEMRMCTEMERANEEENRRVTVMLKRQQQYFESCPEVRDKISREMARSVKYANLAQILEKDDRMREERRLDKLWHEIMLREIEEKRKRDDEEKQKRLMKGKETSIILVEQMANSLTSSDDARRLSDEEHEKLEKLWADVRIEEMNELERERTKRMKLKQDLEEQLLLVKQRLADEARHKAAIENKLRMENQAELERDKINILQKSANLHREMMAYMKSLEDLRREEAARNAEVEAIIDKSSRDIAERHNLAIERYNENRKRLLNDVMAARDNQLKEKQEIKNQERKRFDEERELYKKEMEREAAESVAQINKRREMALRYGEELKAQCDLLKIKKYHDAKMSQKPEHDPKHLDECKKYTEKLLNAPEIITPSAFKVMLKECAARRETEQKLFVDCTTV
ncbi:hypothetical protein PV328_003480 [Microctonus aethiopoides]|uniref:Trichohyalin-plectin-homology domain-containing protein n=1 Tax=Microctonus aethiopoides TaxID=144406 RepID=A0AA39F8H5_9HYME|nr:hypothetical protein PV328_003480 [Microctonus aethiopoides]